MPSSTKRRRSRFYPRSLLLFERQVDWRITGRWTLYSAAVGVLGALGALVFANLVTLLTDLSLVGAVGYALPLPGGEGDVEAFALDAALSPSRRWMLLIVPTLGGLAAGWLVFTFAPEAEGHGTDAVIRAFHRNQGEISARIPLIKTVASALTIGTGGSAGREGPIAHIGAALASLAARQFRLNVHDRRMLLIAGTAAGVAAIFKSPLGGALFAVEVLYREDMEAEALMPAVIAGITGYSVYSGITGSGTVFQTPRFHFVSPVEFLPLLVFAVVCAALGIAFVTLFYGVRSKIFDRLPVPRHVKPAIGGFVVGSIAFFFPAVLGSSYGWLQQAIYGTLPIWLMAALVVGKMVATSFTIGSGGSGGVFAPSLVIGGMLGGVFSTGLQLIAPDLIGQPESYVLIGMATFFAGVANVPLSTTVMISELTGSYTLLVPLLLSGVLVHVTARRWSLYREQVRSHNDSPAHRPDFVPAVLRHTPVRSVIEYPVYYHVVDTSHTIEDALSIFMRTREVVMPVVAAGTAEQEHVRYEGLVLLDDVQSLLASDVPGGGEMAVGEIIVPFASVSLDDTLQDVLETFGENEYPEMPVVDETGRIVGFVRQGQIVSEYYRAFVRWKSQGEGDGS